MIGLKGGGTLAPDGDLRYAENSQDSFYHRLAWKFGVDDAQIRKEAKLRTRLVKHTFLLSDCFENLTLGTNGRREDEKVAHVCSETPMSSRKKTAMCP